MQGVSLIMPMRNEAADIGDVLESIRTQRYPHAAMRLIVVDGGSTDSSPEIVRAWLEKSDISGEVVTNPRNTIPTSFNIGLACARPEDVIVRLDAHTTYDPNYVAALVDGLVAAPSNVGCVGGSVFPEAEPGRFDHSLVAALYTNPVGLGGATYRFAEKPCVVGSVYLGAWRPGLLQAAGGFDERWEANEDSELAIRLRRIGYDSYWVPAISSYRVKRGPISAVRQWGRYGYWRSQTLRRHPREWRIRHVLPPLALLASALLLVSPLRALAAVAFLCYAIALFSKRARGESLSVTAASCVFFPACQIAWTLGLLRGLIAGIPQVAEVKGCPESFAYAAPERVTAG
jgi:succinoglycan biosynthesis protein ExoA